MRDEGEAHALLSLAAPLLCYRSALKDRAGGRESWAAWRAAVLLASLVTAAPAAAVCLWACFAGREVAEGRRFELLDGRQSGGGKSAPSAPRPGRAPAIL